MNSHYKTKSATHENLCAWKLQTETQIPAFSPRGHFPRDSLRLLRKKQEGFTAVAIRDPRKDPWPGRAMIVLHKLVLISPLEPTFRRGTTGKRNAERQGSGLSSKEARFSVTHPICFGRGSHIRSREKGNSSRTSRTPRNHWVTKGYPRRQPHKSCRTLTLALPLPHRVTESHQRGDTASESHRLQQSPLNHRPMVTPYTRSCVGPTNTLLWHHTRNPSSNTRQKDTLTHTLEGAAW